MNTKYIVWVGGIDDHYTSEEEAKKLNKNGLMMDMMMSK